ncbi:vWA domain-containing protein [Myceligenerans pegani]|uniref:VWA domain-containing protein n=1 Tax=Myceligenerans pegani TaxID=2776917 RepID=A0ABR9MXW0_9MICO|nr:VWA domain-containing protein [Myceligenerans sp. TRM 65318]MBE1875754.1 VWA domain-containing protein [Myceligenerans sp. TRM 65318]MBE3018025.1 VWA domain-containing protein [Myceligenerans sp. TRM 65318]
MSDDGERVLLGFTRALRAAGVGVTHDRATSFLQATAVLGAGSAVSTYRAGRATLCGGPEDLARFDQVFAAWFGSSTLGLPVPRGRTAAGPAHHDHATRDTDLPHPAAGGGFDRAAQTFADRSNGFETLPNPIQYGVVADDRETLRHRDVAGLTEAERRVLAAQLAALRPRPPLRRAARTVPWHRGRPDLHRTLRASLRRAGEPARIERRRRARTPRRVVLLVDVSGSMRPYAEALLRLAHAVVRSAAPAGARRAGTRFRAEAFTLGTRLTRVTDALRTADPERALARAGDLVPDWAGGTRLAGALATLTDRHGARLRGAVVVVCSDGWERGDPADLADRAARLHRLAHAVVWVNPHRGKAGYRPVQSGIVAVLPYVDHFLAGHSLGTFEEVLEVIARA